MDIITMNLEIIENIRRKLKEHYLEILDILNKIESYETAQVEYCSSMDCLEHAYLESRYWGKHVKLLAYFMAVNQPLYGLMLALMSSFCVQETFVRPATDTVNVVKELVKILNLEEFFTGFHVLACERLFFLDKYLKNADAVYFVGKYENAKKIQKLVKPSTLFLFSGTGINPFVIGEKADIQLAARKAVSAGLYNSGQDCGRPKAFLVHESKLNEFLLIMVSLIS